MTISLAPDAVDLALELAIRLVGALWVFGAIASLVMVWRWRRYSRMADRIEEMMKQVEPGPEDSGPDDRGAKAQPGADPRAAAWMEKDAAARRRWIFVQSLLLAATGLAMAMFHPTSVWLIALLILGQGVYFGLRERAVRAAPTLEAAEEARPSRSTVNAGWFSLGVGALIWIAYGRGAWTPWPV